MNKFITSSEKEYHKEKKKRELRYKRACKKSGKLFDFYMKNNTSENHKKFFDAFRQLDDTYKDWMDNIEFIYKE